MRLRAGVAIVVAFLVGLITLFSPGAVFAQDESVASEHADSLRPALSDLEIGTQLRVSYLSAYGPQRTHGYLVALSSDSLRLGKGVESPETIALADVEQVERFLGKKKATMTGGLIGAFVGLAGGAALGATLANVDTGFGSSSGSSETVGAAVAFGLAGGLAGYLVGSVIGSQIVSRQWEAVPVAVEQE